MLIVDSRAQAEASPPRGDLTLQPSGLNPQMGSDAHQQRFQPIQSGFHCRQGPIQIPQQAVVGLGQLAQVGSQGVSDPAHRLAPERWARPAGLVEPRQTRC